MKLRNKKTGEIIETGRNFLRMPDSRHTEYGSLEDLILEWEDYEEPSKTIWQIKDSGELQDFEEDDFSDGYIESSKSIGNYFDTREEAEKAVEKLKAWKRLKDKGFRFTGIAGISNNIFVSFETDSEYSGGHIMYDEYSNTDNNLREYNKDLALLFGGED